MHRGLLLASRSFQEASGLFFRAGGSGEFGVGFIRAAGIGEGLRVREQPGDVAQDAFDGRRCGPSTNLQ
jgi:hypothetical protein